MYVLTKNKKVCELCRKEFSPKGNSQKYCSKECSLQGRILTVTEYKIFLQKKHKVICRFCGKEIAPFFREGIHRGNMHDLCRLKYLAEKWLNNIALTRADRSMMSYHGITMKEIKDYIRNPQEWEV